MLFYVHRNRRFIRDGKPVTPTSTFTQLLSSAYVPNSKHCFTTSFLPWRKVPESDARSVRTYRPPAYTLYFKGEPNRRPTLAWKRKMLRCCCCRWSFLYSAILRSRADSLLHVILNEFDSAFWISAKVVYLQRCFGCCMAGAMWNRRVLCTPYNRAPC